VAGLGGGESAQAAEGTDYKLTVRAADEHVARPAAAPPGDDLDGLAALEIAALAGHTSLPTRNPPVRLSPRTASRLNHGNW